MPRRRPQDLHLTASLEEQARRRRDDLLARGVDRSPERVTEDIRRRDRVDSTRSASPTRVADGAVVVDSSEMDVEQVANT